MKLLVLGGTQFLGRHVVETALVLGHDVTILNRGRTAPGLFPGVEELHADRDGPLDVLAGRTWDAVVDTSGYVPRQVRSAATALADATEHYTFVSSLSVYATNDTAGANESAQVATLDDPNTEEVTGETYGPLKALCEQAAEQVLAGRVLNVRAGLIVGPYDPTDRFTYWVRRASRGGVILAPGDPDTAVQLIDARDLAAWILDAAVRRVAGTFNATSPPFSFGELLETCRSVGSADATLEWVEASWLLERGVAPWSDLPVWAPPVPGYEGFMRRSVDGALAAGLQLRALRETVADTAGWDAGRDGELQAGLSADRERELLEQWRSR